jgi:hypothetical protein
LKGWIAVLVEWTGMMGLCSRGKLPHLHQRSDVGPCEADQQVKLTSSNALHTCVRHRTGWHFLASSYVSRQCSSRYTARASSSRQIPRTWRHTCCEARKAQSCPIALSPRQTKHIALVDVAQTCGVKLDLKARESCIAPSARVRPSATWDQCNWPRDAAQLQLFLRPLWEREVTAFLTVTRGGPALIWYDGSSWPN